jgi:hypothetical protein
MSLSGSEEPRRDSSSIALLGDITTSLSIELMSMGRAEL